MSTRDVFPRYRRVSVERSWRRSPRSNVSGSSGSKRVAHTPTTGAPNAPRMRAGRELWPERGLHDRRSVACCTGRYYINRAGTDEPGTRARISLAT